MRLLLLLPNPSLWVEPASLLHQLLIDLCLVQSQAQVSSENGVADTGRIAAIHLFISNLIGCAF